MEEKILEKINEYIKEDVYDLEVYLVGSLSESYEKATRGEKPYDADIVIDDDFTMKSRDNQSQIDDHGKVLLQHYEIGLDLKGEKFGIHLHDKSLEKNGSYKKIN